MHAMEYLQLGSVADDRTQPGYFLYSRAINYKPEMWEDATYKKRRFFDWGRLAGGATDGGVAHWRVVSAP